MSGPLAIDLYAGLGGWTDGLLAEGWRVIGFDTEQHDYGDGRRYLSQLVLQDVLTLHGRQFRDAALIVASPPCQAYSYMAMPWSRAKARAAEYRGGVRDVTELTALFDACFRIQREAIEAAGRFIPLVVENVKGAQPWVGRSRWNFGSFHLWGDVPALMPITGRPVMKQGIAHRPHGETNFPGYKEGHKVPNFRFDGSGRSFQTASVNETGIKAGDAGWRERGPGRQLQDRAIKNNGGSWFTIGSPGQKETGRNPVQGFKGIPHRPRTNPEEHGTKQGGDWFNAGQPSLSRMCSSKSPARKAAAAEIARIPFTLARHIAWAWWPAQA